MEDSCFAQSYSAHTLIITEYLTTSLDSWLIYCLYSFYWTRLTSDDMVKGEGRKKGKKS